MKGKEPTFFPNIEDFKMIENNIREKDIKREKRSI